MSQNRHEPYEELISASLRNDINPAERDRLNAHLDGCEQCRQTLAAFSNQRRIVAGLRHITPPRDLDARIRAGIESGAAAVPWWKRPQVALAGIGDGLALVAGAAFALVLLNNQASTPVGQVSPTASASIAPSGTPVPTLPPPASAGPSLSPSIEASPAETPMPSPEPALFLAVTGPVDNQLLTVRDGPTTETVMEVGDVPPGEPVAAEMSPDGQWIAYITTVGESGLTDVRATRLAEGIASDDPDALPPIDSPVEIGHTVLLGEGVAGGPFLEHLFWSADSRYLAYTLADPDGTGTDVWIFEPGAGEPRRLTDTGAAYAGSWADSNDSSGLLWVSTAGDTPRSDLVSFHHDSGGAGGPVDPTESGFGHAENVFQPLVSPNGAFVIFWTGRMVPAGDEWLFSEGGAPWLAENTADGSGGYEFTSARELFGDVTIGRDAFASAAIAWGGDSDSYAVWDADWMGIPQGGDEAYPDRTRVYFGHATDPRRLTRTHAIDEADLPDDAFVVDVKVSPTGRHLVITAAQPRAGVLEAPRADLLLVERNTGSVPDEVFELGSSADGWFGPATFGR